MKRKRFLSFALPMALSGAPLLATAQGQTVGYPSGVRTLTGIRSNECTIARDKDSFIKQLAERGWTKDVWTPPGMKPPPMNFDKNVAVVAFLTAFYHYKGIDLTDNGEVTLKFDPIADAKGNVLVVFVPSALYKSAKKCTVAGLPPMVAMNSLMTYSVTMQEKDAHEKKPEGLFAKAVPEQGANPVGEKQQKQAATAASPVSPASGEGKETNGAITHIQRMVRDIIVEQLGVDEAEVTPNASFVDDLGADSLDTVELVMAFEETFDIEIPDEDAERIRTVKDAVDYIEAHAKRPK